MTRTKKKSGQRDEQRKKLLHGLGWIGRYEFDTCPYCGKAADFFAVGASGVCLSCGGRMIPLSIAARRRIAKAGRQIVPRKRVTTDDRQRVRVL